MRIITGSARGTVLEAPKGLHTRPTAERTKEAIFSAIQFSVEGRRVLDLFAGSGQMALEALSRGAKEAVCADADREALGVIQRNAKKTRLDGALRIMPGDALHVLGKLKGEKFDLVFLDPPYASDLVAQSLCRLSDYGLLNPFAYIVCETPSYEAVFGADETLKQHFSVYRQYRYGVAYVTILRPRTEENA